MKTSFSAHQRKKILEFNHKRTVDLLVIGGGITGSGIALDAVTRGLETVVVEMQDFAAGTSSRSTKLVHGGLRYLKQFEVKMVSEVGKERAVVYENGPHVTTPEWMLLPLYEGGTFGKLSTSFGLKVYDFLAGVKKSEQRKMLSTKEVIELEPLLKREGLKGGGYYVEYKTDDARLTIEVMKEAVHQGAHAINYAKVEEFIYKLGKVIGAVVVDQLTGERYEIYARKIVNATGPWVDTLREKDGSKKGKTLQLTKGVHLVFDQSRFPLKQAIYFDTPDGRMIFAIPREGKTYVGTTDTVYQEDMAHPKMSKEDRDYILRAVNDMFPKLNIVESDIESSWAGLRPLIHEEGKSPSEISRKDEIWQSDSGLITIAGGKLTGYRKMAEMVVDLVMTLMDSEGYMTKTGSVTMNLPISGGHVGGSKQFEKYVSEKAFKGVASGLSPEQSEMLVRKYGSNIDTLLEMIPSYHQDVAANLDLPLDLYLILKYSIEHEMAVKPIDFFIRRTGSLLFNIDFVYEWKELVIDYMAKVFEWNNDQKKEYAIELDVEITNSVVCKQPESHSIAY